jgi:hypothetical protein
MVALEDRVEELGDEVADLKGEPRPPRAATANERVAGAVSNANARVSGAVSNTNARVSGAVSSFAQQVKSNMAARSGLRGGAAASPASPAGDLARQNSPLTRRAAAAMAASKTD